MDSGTITTAHISKLKLPTNIRDVMASQLLYKQCALLVQQADIIVAEIPIGSKSASAMKSYGICCAVLGSVAGSKELVRVTPQSVKKTAGYDDATKDEVIEFVLNKHPEIKVITRKVNNQKVLVKKSIEHIADAVTALHAALATTSFNQKVLGLRKSTMKLNYVLTQEDILNAIAVFASEQSGNAVEVKDITMGVANNEVIATIESEIKSVDKADAAKPAGRTRRSLNKADEADATEAEPDTKEEAKPAATRRTRRSTAATEGKAEAVEETKPATAGRRTRRTEAAKPQYDEEGYDADGYDKDGFDRDGFDKDGYDAEGYNENDEHREDVEAAAAAAAKTTSGRRTRRSA